jgi:mRNA-degrading endonuclease RelE of RelBE toxin-antitoxin system
VGPYTILVSAAAAKYLERCDAPTRDRLQRKLEALKADPFDTQSSKPLKGRKEQRSARVGGLRILFRVVDLVIVVAKIGPRGEIYRKE